jgi:hypothetical protein
VRRSGVSSLTRVCEVKVRFRKFFFLWRVFVLGRSCLGGSAGISMAGRVSQMYRDSDSSLKVRT